ncbi:MAG: hypothetical protein COV99_04105 [Bacteroidetes bacterium CG12_big_fil_rev_8_21_14_0_65_60_17]|nr:MAG: hypothetical protein COV99_04105 [Bacteroidetes bacterium CG12_big_fil_rev_8_21_14_0_65_60_17]
MNSRRFLHDVEPRADAWPTSGLIVLVIFTLMALGGYWFFGLHPENLARFPSSAAFYSVSYSFFAQSQVWLSGIVLAFFLVRSTEWRWIAGFALVYVLSLSSELVGTNTGFPFGEYRYTSLLGTKWFGHVPIVIPLSWYTMVLPAHIITGRLTKWQLSRPVHWLLTGILLTIWDLALDPAMSHLVVYWQWGVEGAYYGMPWVNLAGWLFTGIILSMALDGTGVRRWESNLSSRWVFLYYITLFALPFGMLIAAGAWAAALLSAGILVAAIMAYGKLGQRMKNVPTRISSGNDEALSQTPKSDSPTEESAYLNAVIRSASADAWAFFRHHSRSFSFSSRLFSRRYRRLVTSLYVFCRITDDLADESDIPTQQRMVLLEDWRCTVREAYDHETSKLPWLNELAAELKASGMSLSVMESLIDGVCGDTGRVRIQTEKELKDYSYSVASTVGIMMCHLFGQTDTWTLSRAAALGRAMQITNILRDVKQDLVMDRVYVPSDVLAREGLLPRDLMVLLSTDAGGDELDNLMKPYRNALKSVVHLAEEEYSRAWEAIPSLPSSFGPPVAVAAEVYRGILRKLQLRNYNNLDTRIVTTPTEKLWYAMRGLCRYGFGRVRYFYALRTTTPDPVRYRQQGS